MIFTNEFIREWAIWREGSKLSARALQLAHVRFLAS